MKSRTNRRRSMEFSVGPYIYRVRVVRNQIIDDATGKSLLGQALLHGRELLIWSGVMPEQRMEILLHELKHAWLFHVPPALNQEDAATLFALVSEQARNDLARNGGLKALMRLRAAPRPRLMK